MKILLAIDGSKFSDAATNAVIVQAKSLKSEVHVLHVIDVLSNQLPEMMTYYPGIEHARDAQRKPAEAIVTRAAELLCSEGLRVTTAVELGNPKSKIIDAAAEWRADLIVLGSHGRTGLDRFMMGSVPDAVLRHAHCSVELVRIPSGSKHSRYVDASVESKVTRILFPTDDSKCSESALQLLIEQARPRETDVRVLCVVEPPPLLVAREMGGYDPALESVWDFKTKQAQNLVAKTAEILCAQGVDVSTAVEQGDVKSKVLDAAEDWHADLIVLGSHGRSGRERFLMGSVSDAVARHARCSVEVVRIPPAH
jgi:nucleotide-binding universal stress UspA family protein